MKPRQQRLLLLLGGLISLGIAATLVLSAFRKNIVFFYTPTQVSAGEVPKGRSFRIGGLVESGSLQRQPDGLSVHFVVTDVAHRVPVVYRGPLPDLFKEGKGVVAQGHISAQGTQFLADEVLAKHDENYTPPEASEALRRAELGRSTPSAAASALDRPQP